MSPWRSDRGAAALEFAMVVPLLMGLVLAVCQVGVWLLTTSEAQRVADRAAAISGRAAVSPGSSVHVAQDVLAAELAEPATAQVRPSNLGGAPAVVIDISVPLRLGSWVTPLRATVTAAAILEPR